MRRSKLLTTVALAMTVGVGCAQLTPTPAQAAPAQSDAQEKAAELVMRGKDRLVEGRTKEAAEAFQKALTILPSHGEAKEGLAHAYMTLGRDAEALKIYRPMVKFDAGWNDLYTSAGIVQPVLFRYAILLARNGEVETAKAVYYAGLRFLNPKGFLEMEPLPLKVVFDSDPHATVWSYTPQRLEAAAEMALAMISMAEGAEARIAHVDRARTLAPDWGYPALYKAMLTGEAKYYDEAEHLEKDRKTLGAIRGYRAAHTGDEAALLAWRQATAVRGPDARAQILLLEETRLRLKSDLRFQRP
ncbi:MAG: tetratricopeptide repeat protein [Fimbriimonas sp.]